jgi:hypothetical protein
MFYKVLYRCDHRSYSICEECYPQFKKWQEQEKERKNLARKSGKLRSAVGENKSK